MNYIKEINAFYNEIEVTPLSASAIALWHALLHICNRTGWKREFSVPVGTLSLKSGLSERSVSNARNELKTKGFIDFKSRGGNRAAVYQLVGLSANIADSLSDNHSGNASDTVSGNTSDNLSALFKQNINTNKTSSLSMREAVDEIEGYMRIKTVNPQYAMVGKDFEAAKVLLDEGIPLEFIQQGIDEAFAAYQPKGKLDKLRNFSYCAPRIEQQWLAKTTRDQVSASGVNVHVQMQATTPKQDERYSAFYKLFPDS